MSKPGTAVNGCLAMRDSRTLLMHPPPSILLASDCCWRTGKPKADITLCTRGDDPNVTIQSGGVARVSSPSKRTDHTSKPRTASSIRRVESPPVGRTTHPIPAAHRHRGLPRDANQSPCSQQDWRSRGTVAAWHESPGPRVPSRKTALVRQAPRRPTAAETVGRNVA